MRYVNLLIVFLASSWCSLHFLLPGRSFRDWREKAVTLLGACGMSFVGLSLYGIFHTDTQHATCGDTFYWAKGLLTGMSIGTFVSLWLEGSLVFFRIGKRKQNRDHGGSLSES